MIRLQFVLGYGIPSRAIAWYSAGVFSHVDAVLPDGRLLGARSDCIKPLGYSIKIPAGVQIRPANYEKWKERVVMSIPCSETEEHNFLQFNHSQLNKPYDMSAIWGFVAGRDWRERDSWFCSELQGTAIEFSGRCPKLYTPLVKLTPAALATVASALGGTWE